MSSFFCCTIFQRRGCLMLQKATEEKFLSYALELLRERLIEEGIFVRSIDKYKDFVLEIGEVYYQLKKKEELPLD